MLHLGLVTMVGIVLSCILVYFAIHGDSTWCAMIGVFVVMCTVIAGIFFCVYAWDYTAAKYRAVIINREYGTSYTREEIFYASNVIDTIRELDRERVEINGNLLQKTLKEE